MVQGLDLRLLVHRQDNRPLRRVHVQSDDVDDLLREVGIGAEVERREQVGLEIGLRPDAGNSVPRHAGMPAHERKGPARRLRRKPVHGHVQDAADLVGRNLAGAARARAVAQPVHPPLKEAIPGRIRRVDIASKTAGNGVAAASVHQPEDNLRAQGHALRRGGLPKNRLNGGPLSGCVGKGEFGLHGEGLCSHVLVLSRIFQTRH